MHTPESTDPDSADDDRWQEDNRHVSALILRARAGQLDAFEDLYNCTARWLLSRVRRFVDDGQAEDVLAEVYLQVWRTLDSYDERRAAPRVWLAMIARSRALDHLRREKRRGEAHDCPQFAVSVETVQEEGPEQLFSRMQERHLVQVSLAGALLSADERNVLDLAYFHDHTQHDIALLTGIPLGTVKTIMAPAQAKLRAKVAGGGAQGPRAAQPMGPSP